jgi:hypothetical protein
MNIGKCSAVAVTFVTALIASHVAAAEKPSLRRVVDAAIRPLMTKDQIPSIKIAPRLLIKFSRL